MLGCFIWPSTDTSLRASSLSFRDICMCTVHNKPTTKLLTSCEAIHDLSHQFTQGHTLQLVTKDTHCNLSHTATCHTGHTLQLGTQGHTLQLGTQDTHCNLSHRDKHCNLSHRDTHCNLSHRDTHCNLSHKDTHCNLSHRTHTATCHTGTHTATNLSHRTHTTVLHKHTRLTFEMPISFTTKSFPESFCLTRRALPNEPSPIFFTRSNLSITRAAVEGGTINTPFCDRLRAHTRSTVKQPATHICTCIPIEWLAAFSVCSRERLTLQKRPVGTENSRDICRIRKLLAGKMLRNTAFVFVRVHEPIR